MSLARSEMSCRSQPLALFERSNVMSLLLALKKEDAELYVDDSLF